MTTKDHITCHVLDTLTGRPAAGVDVILQFNTAQLGLFTSETIVPKHLYTFEAITNADGRITNWEGPINLPTIGPALDFCKQFEKPTAWSLTFDTGNYYGEGNTFWPEVQLKFFVKPGEHYHVPLLLGPYSYTTYRGS